MHLSATSSSTSSSCRIMAGLPPPSPPTPAAPAKSRAATWSCTGSSRSAPFLHSRSTSLPRCTRACHLTGGGHRPGALTAGDLGHRALKASQTRGLQPGPCHPAGRPRSHTPGRPAAVQGPGRGPRRRCLPPVACQSGLGCQRTSLTPAVHGQGSRPVPPCAVGHGRPGPAFLLQQLCSHVRPPLAQCYAGVSMHPRT